MIRSVGVGGSSVSNQQRRTQKSPEVPFPKLDGLENDSVETAQQSKPLMVGVKANPEQRSILEEKDHYIRVNADGDSLEVSKKAISLARVKFAI